jgi:hypothetical protein
MHGVGGPSTADAGQKPKNKGPKKRQHFVEIFKNRPANAMTVHRENPIIDDQSTQSRL